MFDGTYMIKFDDEYYGPFDTQPALYEYLMYLAKNTEDPLDTHYWRIIPVNTPRVKD